MYVHPMCVCVGGVHTRAQAQQQWRPLGCGAAAAHMSLQQFRHFINQHFSMAIKRAIQKRPAAATLSQPEGQRDDQGFMRLEVCMQAPKHHHTGGNMVPTNSADCRSVTCELTTQLRQWDLPCTHPDHNLIHHRHGGKVGQRTAELLAALGVQFRQAVHGLFVMGYKAMKQVESYMLSRGFRPCQVPTRAPVAGTVECRHYTVVKSFSSWPYLGCSVL